MFPLILTVLKRDDSRGFLESLLRAAKSEHPKVGVFVRWRVAQRDLERGRGRAPRGGGGGGGWAFFG